MKKVIVLSMGLAMLFMVAVEVHAAQDIIVLTSAAPDTVVATGTTAFIYGTSDANQVTIEKGAEAELINFPGSNTVTIQSESGLFTVIRSGATVTFQGSDGTVLKIPATASVQTIFFNDQTLTLLIQVMLDDQVIGLSSDLISQAASCTYSILPSSGSFTASGGTSSVSVTASSSTCTWTASESLSWVRLSSTSGTGSVSITITATENTGVVRNGSITIAGQTYTVSQSEITSEQPGAAIQISPSGTINTTTPTYTWDAVSNASHYYLFPENSTSSILYSASDAGCDGGTGTISITTGITLANGNYTWYVQPKNSYGDGPLSSGMNFTVLFSPGWSSGTPMPTGRYWAASAVVDNEVYVIGGGGGGSVVEKYNTLTDSWATLSSMPFSDFF